MADTNRTLAAILALLADNTTGDISPQDLRDSIISVFANYALIGVAGGATGQTTNATPGTFDKVTGFTTDGLAAGAVAANAVSDKLTVSVDGVYLIMWQAAFSGTANAVMEGRIYGGGAAATLGRWANTLDAAGAKNSVSTFAIMSLTAADDIEAYVTSDGASDTFTPVDMCLAAIKIG